MTDEEWTSILESRGAQDETVGDLPDWEWDVLAADCEGDLPTWQELEDERARKAAEDAWAARARDMRRVA